LREASRYPSHNRRLRNLGGSSNPKGCGQFALGASPSGAWTRSPRSRRAGSGTTTPGAITSPALRARPAPHANFSAWMLTETLFTGR
jgi:hypothetical protein